MRTSTSIAENEISAFTQFALDNKIITDGEVGAENANILCEPIINRQSDISSQTLSQSFARVKDQLKFKSAAHAKADELTLNLAQAEVEAYRSWVARQPRWIGLDGSEEGFENCAALLGWMRGNHLTERSLDLALGNIVNKPQFGRIHFKPQPVQDRSVVGGRKNHALQSNEAPQSTSTQPEFYPNGKRNHNYRQTDAEVKSAEPADPWQTLIDRYMKEWTYPSQRARLQGELDAGLAAKRSRREIAESWGGSFATIDEAAREGLPSSGVNRVTVLRCATNFCEVPP